MLRSLNIAWLHLRTWLAKSSTITKEKSKKCHDCDALPGQLHDGVACDVERCPCCFGQLLTCGCIDAEHPNWIKVTAKHPASWLLGKDEGSTYWWPPDSIRHPWTGGMHEMEEIAIRDGKYVKGEFGARSPCDASHPDARPDLNYGEDKLRRPCPFRKEKQE